MLNLMPDSTTIAVSVLALAVSVVSVMLFLSENRRGKEALKKQTEQVLEKAHTEAMQITSQAIKRGQEIISQARTDTLQFEQMAEKEFQQSAQSAGQLFSKEVSNFAAQLSQVQNEYMKYLDTLKQNMDQSNEDSLQLVKSQVDQLFERFEQNLSDFLTQTEQRTVSSLDLELRAARELINTYKEQQLKVIDENAVAILEQALNTVISKRLTLKDHLDLVHEALEKAKLDKFIV